VHIFIKSHFGGTSPFKVQVNFDIPVFEGQIIDADPTAIVVTTTIQPEEPTDPEEGECLFHSQMWVKGTPLHFIVDSGSQKNLISAEVIKQLGLSTTPHPSHTTSGGFAKDEIFVSAKCRLSYGIQPFKDEVLCDVSPLDVCDVLLGQPYMWNAMLFMSLDPVVSLLLWGVISTEYQR
jgi:hypothetical protein